MGRAIANVGFVALGRMGLPMAGHVQRAGFALHGFDPGEAARAEARALGCAIHETPAALAAATDLAIISAPTDADVEAVITGADGLLAGAPAGFRIAVASSVHPDTLRALDAPCRARGVGLIDAPLTGGIRGAVAANLTVLAGGAVGDVDAARPVFKAFAAHIHHLGPVGSGQIAKMVNNQMLWANFMAAGEALRFAAAAGLDPEALRAVLADCTGDSWALREFPEVHPVWPVKDMATVVAMLGELGLTLPLIEHVAANAKSISIES